ncbi:hypothetical protein ACFL3M_02325, partial [Patescibacteria group bacterium]
GLHSRMWYRLLKVVYIAVLLLSTVYLIGLSFKEEPGKKFDEYNTLVHCEGGATYKAGENEIPFSSASDSFIENSLKRLCMTGRFPQREYSQSDLEDFPKNYSITYAYEDVGSWKSVFVNSVVSITLALVAFEALKRSFYYIYFGTIKPKKK